MNDDLASTAPPVAVAAIAPDAVTPAPAAVLPGLLPTAALEALLAQPERFGFFQAVRLLYRAHGMPPRDGHAAREPLRFSVPASLSFPAGEIATLQHRDDDGGSRYTMTVNFLGLTGPSGTLPAHYTELLIARGKARDHAARDFLDIFNHRLLTLFWHAWARHRTEVAREFGSERGVLRHIYDLVGLGTPSLYARIDPPRGSKAPALPAAPLGYYSGLVAQRPHGVGALAQVVGDIVGAPVHVSGCLGTWQDIPPAQLTRLGRRGHRLGDGCVLGTQFWDRQTTVEVRIGPLGRRGFDALLPDRALLAGVVEVLRFLGGLALDLRIRLLLSADAVPRARLGTARLGWNLWLRGRRSAHPATECHFDYSAMRGESWQ